MNDAFGGFYRGRTVFVTGHTGFKGGWLSSWLVGLGARVVGYALPPPSEPSMFEVTRLAERLSHVEGDVTDPGHLLRALQEHQPSVVLHLAAQSLVRVAYDEPRRTFETNFMGTVNLLDAVRRCDSVEAVVCVTSDKCYENQEWPWGYREIDRLGGHEPYGVSKACAEMAVAVFRDARFRSRAPGGNGAAVAAGRAGNVIGGGDWARDRLLPDMVRAISAGEDVVIRSPRATRPWQHALEAVSGYLWLARCVALDRARFEHSYNFGPPGNALDVPVSEIVQRILSAWPGPSRLVVAEDTSGAEAGLLRLDCTRAERELGWRAAWTLDETLEHLVAWYRAHYEGADVARITDAQIDRYTARAAEQGIAWAVAGA